MCQTVDCQCVWRMGRAAIQYRRALPIDRCVDHDVIGGNFDLDESLQHAVCAVPARGTVHDNRLATQTRLPMSVGDFLIATTMCRASCMTGSYTGCL